MSRKNLYILLIFLIFILFLINYSFLDKKIAGFLIEGREAIVEKIIDGDTIIIENETSIRLLGINSPEKGEFYYEEAKKFLEDSVLNEKVYLEFGAKKYDKYNRILGFVFFENKNMNIELVKQGFANVYIFDNKRYEKQLRAAWQDCIKSEENLCKKSENICASCIKLKEFNSKNQEVVFYNNCKFECELTEWQVKHEGRKKFIFPEFVLQENSDIIIKIGEGNNSQNILFWKEENVLADTDTLFLRDNEGRLVLWENY